jgi:ribonuclease HI
MGKDSQSEWLLMVDGAARGNPGEAGCGAVICDASGQTVRELRRYLGKATNNVAEYEALLMGIEGVLEIEIKKLRIHSDSELLVRQLNGLYRVKDEKLKPLYAKAVELLRRLESYRIIHVKRERNKPADRLANQAIDTALKKSRTG